MNATDLTTYEGQLARLDRDYILDRGRRVNLTLSPGGGPVALDFQPGNGTSYRLLFVPTLGIEQLGPGLVPAGLGDHWQAPASETARWAVVAKVNCTESDWVYPFDLTPGNRAHVSYVAAKTDRGTADAVAITALFRAICDVPLEGSE